MKFKEVISIGYERTKQLGRNDPYTHIFRILGSIATRLFLLTPITPNQVSFLGIICVLTGAGFLAFGEGLKVWYAILFFYLGEVCDYADGNLARCKNRSTKLQADYICRIYHPGTFAAIIAALGISGYRSTTNDIYLYAGFLGALFQQTTIFMMELKNAVILNYRMISTSEIRDGIVGKKQILIKLFSVPIDWLTEIIIIGLVLQILPLLAITYCVYLTLRMILFGTAGYLYMRKVEYGSTIRNT